MRSKILVVDEEEATRRSLEEQLRLEGYQVSTLSNGKETLAALEEDSFDLLVLDLKLPGVQGVELMRAARQIAPDMEIILLASQGSVESAIEALRLEAHDYLLKPVAIEALLGSVASGVSRRVELRRRRMLLHQIETSLQQLKDVERVTASPPPAQKTVDLGGGVMIDLARREIWRGNERVSLTPTEGALMKVLIDHRGRVLTHRELVSLVQGYDTTDFEAPEVLRPLVSRLRRKLATFGAEDWIANIRGTGYVLREIESAGIEKPGSE